MKQRELFNSTVEKAGEKTCCLDSLIAFEDLEFKAKPVIGCYKTLHN